MNNAPLISIVIPCYNDAKYIEQAVNSALNQTYSNIEVIVVDDGSNKETKKVLKKIAPTITKLITQQNKGQSAARNVGIRESKGEYILLLDSDDFFEPTYCNKAFNLIHSNKLIKIVGCYANLIYENDKTILFKPEGGNLNNFLFRSNILASSMFRKKDWSSCKGFDENMVNGWEDWEFFIRLLIKGGKAKIIKEALYNYRKRKNSTTKKANNYRKELLKFIMLKHSDLYILNFRETIEFLLERAEVYKKDELKILNSIDYKIGFYILFPFRKLKNYILNAFN